MDLGFQDWESFHDLIKGSWVGPWNNKWKVRSKGFFLTWVGLVGIFGLEYVDPFGLSRKFGPIAINHLWMGLRGCLLRIHDFWAWILMDLSLGIEDPSFEMPIWREIPKPCVLVEINLSDFLPRHHLPIAATLEWILHQSITNDGWTAKAMGWE